MQCIAQRFRDFQTPMIAEAGPRGISAGPANARATLAALQSKGAQIVYRGTVLPRDIGPDGKADDRAAEGQRFLIDEAEGFVSRRRGDEDRLGSPVPRPRDDGGRSRQERSFGAEDDRGNTTS